MEANSTRVACAAAQRAGADPSVPAPGEDCGVAPGQAPCHDCSCREEGGVLPQVSSPGSAEQQLELQLEISEAQGDGGGRAVPPFPLSFEPRTRLWGVILGGCPWHLGSLFCGVCEVLAVLYLVAICYYFLTVAVPVVSKLTFSFTSTCIRYLLVERNWLNL